MFHLTIFIMTYFQVLIEIAFIENCCSFFFLAASGILSSSSIFHWPRAQEKWRQLAWLLVWPIHLVFLITIPDCEKPRFKRWFPLTFLMCIVWIGSLSYVVAWMITIIGELPSESGSVYVFVSYGAEMLHPNSTVIYNCRVWMSICANKVYVQKSLCYSYHHLTGIFIFPFSASPLTSYQWSWTSQHIHNLVLVM